MKEVRRDELVNICTWKIICEWLRKIVLDIVIQSQSGGEYNILNPIQYVNWAEAQTWHLMECRCASNNRYRYPNNDCPNIS